MNGWSARQLNSPKVKLALLALNAGAIATGIWLGRLVFDTFG